MAHDGSHEHMHVIGHDHVASQPVMPLVEMPDAILDESGDGRGLQRTGAMTFVEFVLELGAEQGRCFLEGLLGNRLG